MYSIPFMWNYWVGGHFVFSKVEEYITNVSSFLCHVPRVLCYVARVLCLLSSPPPRKHAHEFLGRGKSRKWRDEEAWCLKIVQPAMHPGIRERNVGGISAAWKLGGLIFRRQRSSVRKARRPSYLGGSLSRLITRLFNSRWLFPHWVPRNEPDLFVTPGPQIELKPKPWIFSQKKLDNGRDDWHHLCVMS